MAKHQKKHEVTVNHRWVKVIPWKGRARMEKRELKDSKETGRVLTTHGC